MAAPIGTNTDWNIVNYEADMFFGLCDVLDKPEARTGNSCIDNAVVESVCLHARILTDIFLSNKASDDDIVLSELLPDFQSRSVDGLRTAYGHAKAEGFPRWTLNKMLAHPTKKRDTTFNYTPVLLNLRHHIEAVWRDIQNHRGTPAKLPQPNDNRHLNFCAKTSS